MDSDYHRRGLAVSLISKSFHLFESRCSNSSWVCVKVLTLTVNLESMPIFRISLTSETVSVLFEETCFGSVFGSV